jgi:hypothetical protein
MVRYHWEEVTLGRSSRTETEEDRIEFLRDLAESSALQAVEFLPSSDGAEDDTGLVTSILEAIRRKPNVTALCFNKMEDQLPFAHCVAAVQTSFRWN